jgi:GNAT superfamily N-acetyltransferase
MSTEITSEFVWHNIPPRPRDSHKGSFGTVLAVAGSAYYRGAALLAAEGALRTGAGIVTLASVEPVLAAAVARLPECCLCPCVAGADGGISPESIPQLQRQKATVLLLGPVAVHPTAQGEGLGGLLIREGLWRAESQGWVRVMLVGDEPYYRRFGFRKLEHVQMPPPTNPERVLGLELEPGAWQGVEGAVTRDTSDNEASGTAWRSIGSRG